MNTYEKIQFLCDDKGIKPATLCKECGINKSTLSELKAGRTQKPSTQTLSKISQYFGVSLDFFNEDDSVEAQKDELFEKRKLLFDMSKRANAEQLDSFINMLKSIIPPDDTK